MKIVLWLKVFKFMLLAYLLTLILGLGQIIFGVYLGITEIDISETSNEVMSILLISEVSLPLFMFSYYRKNKQELIIVTPFPRQRLLLNYFFGYSIGAVLFTVIWVIAWLLNGIFIKNVWNIDSMNMLFVLFLGYGIQGMGEEIICRGYLQGRLTQILSVKLAVILSALFFSCLHLSNDGITVIAFIVLFLFGLIVSIIRYQTNNLWIVGAFHSAWNFIQGPVLGVAVSGSSSDSLVIQSINLPGKEYLSGGEFGLEGSLLSLLFLSISLVFVIIWSKTHIHTSL